MIEAVVVTVVSSYLIMKLEKFDVKQQKMIGDIEHIKCKIATGKDVL